MEGNKIASTYRENKEFYLNVENGKYKPVGSEGLYDIDKKFPKMYIKKLGGAEIVERYLMDDLWETMEVDGQFQPSIIFTCKYGTNLI